MESCNYRWLGWICLFVEVKKYRHVKSVITGSGQKEHELLPHVHMVDSLVKRWINGTHQGRITQKYLCYYLDEYAFRFNRKLSHHRGKAFLSTYSAGLNDHPCNLDSNYQVNTMPSESSLHEGSR